MTIQRRLETLERRASSSDGMTVFMILGGLPEPYLKTATAGPHKWLQELDDSLDAFRDRVIELTKASGERCVMIGGLPDDADNLECKLALWQPSGK